MKKDIIKMNRLGEFLRMCYAYKNMRCLDSEVSKYIQYILEDFYRDKDICPHCAGDIETVKDFHPKLTVIKCCRTCKYSFYHYPKEREINEII